MEVLLRHNGPVNVFRERTKTWILLWLNPADPDRIAASRLNSTDVRLNTKILIENQFSHQNINTHDTSVMQGHE